MLTHRIAWTSSRPGTWRCWRSSTCALWTATATGSTRTTRTQSQTAAARTQSVALPLPCRQLLAQRDAAGHPTRGPLSFARWVRAGRTAYSVCNAPRTASAYCCCSHDRSHSTGNPVHANTFIKAFLQIRFNQILYLVNAEYMTRIIWVIYKFYQRRTQDFGSGWKGQTKFPVRSQEFRFEEVTFSKKLLNKDF